MAKQKQQNERWYAHLLTALQGWHEQDLDNYKPFEALTTYQRIKAELGSETESPVLVAMLRHLIEQLEAASIEGRKKVRVLRLRFEQNISVAESSHRLSISKETLHRHQRWAINALSKLLDEQEHNRRPVITSEWETQLGTKSYDKLFGTAELEAKLLGHLTNLDEDSIALVLGMGGIGKTAIADSVTRSVMQADRFAHLVWVAYAPQGGDAARSADDANQAMLLKLAAQPHINARHLPPKVRDERVRQALQQTPHFVVVDNIEKPQTAQGLLPLLSRYGGESRFMVTSRAEASIARVRPFMLEELSEADSVAYMRHLADGLNFEAFANATAAQLRPIYDALGGNPLALQLAVGLGQKLSFNQLLVELRSGLSDRVTGLYTRIYHNLWGTLSDEAKRLLGSMVFVSGDISAERLQLQSRLENEMFVNAVDELTKRSLLEVRGTPWERSYAIHQLTRTFLQSKMWGGV